MDEERFNQAYDWLVRQTTNPRVLHNQKNNDNLHKLLELMEWLKGEGDTEEEPIKDFFYFGVL